MILSLATRIYIAVLVLLAVLLAIAAYSLDTPLISDSVLLALGFAFLMLLASRFTLPFTSTTKVTLDTAVIFAAILLLPPIVAIAIAAAGKVAGQLLRRNALYQVTFNSAQAALQAGVGGMILAYFSWNPLEMSFNQLGSVPGPIMAAVAMYLVNTISIAGVVAVRRHTNFASSWRVLAHSAGLEHLSQLALGLMAAAVVDTHIWALPLFLLPGIAIYRSLERNLQIKQWADEAIRNKEQSLSQAQRIAHLGSWEWNLLSGERLCSDEAHRIYGFDVSMPSATLPQVLRVIYPDDREIAGAAIKDMMQAGRGYDLEYRIVRPDGVVRTIHEQTEVVMDSLGRPIRALGTVHDVTERKHAEEQREELLAEVERALEFRNQFLSITSHELKTPITILKGYAQLLHERAQQLGLPKMLKPIDVINRQATVMSTLIDDLLDLSRLENDKIAFTADTFDLNDVVEHALQDVTLNASEFELRLDRPGEPVYVVGDDVRIQQVISNLLTNAVKYSGERKVVEVSVRAEAGQARVSVRDYGIGVAEQDQERVFDLYYRASNLTSTHSGGLGLGLYISRIIVERHGGAMRLTSTLGEGSEFTFSLPLSAVVAPAVVEPADAHPSTDASPSGPPPVQLDTSARRSA